MRADWQKLGDATGLVVCRLTLPALDLDLDRRFHGEHAILEVRQFLERQLPAAQEAHVGGLFTITAEFRAPRGGVRRRVLSQWREGESIMAALDRAAAEWGALSKEAKPLNDLKGEHERSIGSVAGTGMTPPSDWQLRNQEEYLTGVTLVRRTWREYRPGWDHDHCAFCWATFSAFEGDLHEGWTTQDEYRWICDSCFSDFRAQFLWTAQDA